MRADLYVAPDEFGDDTVWLHDPKQPDMPKALLSSYGVQSRDFWDYIVRDLPTSPPAGDSDNATADRGHQLRP